MLVVEKIIIMMQFQKHFLYGLLAPIDDPINPLQTATSNPQQKFQLFLKPTSISWRGS